MVYTKKYISPKANDIWSAWFILYAMLSGTFPFDGKNDKNDKDVKTIFEKKLFWQNALLAIFQPFLP